jgi:hypothetical protein
MNASVVHYKYTNLLIPVTKSETEYGEFQAPTALEVCKPAVIFVTHHVIVRSKWNSALSTLEVDSLTLASKPEIRMVKRLEAQKN